MTDKTKLRYVSNHPRSGHSILNTDQRLEIQQQSKTATKNQTNHNEMFQAQRTNIL
jgi:hypothetical protein